MRPRFWIRREHRVGISRRVLGRRPAHGSLRVTSPVVPVTVTLPPLVETETSDPSGTVMSALSEQLPAGTEAP